MIIPDPALRLLVEVPQQAGNSGLPIWEVFLYGMLGGAVVRMLERVYHYIRR